MGLRVPRVLVQEAQANACDVIHEEPLHMQSHTCLEIADCSTSGVEKNTRQAYKDDAPANASADIPIMAFIHE